MLCLFGMISIVASAIPNNTIYYTTTDGEILNPYMKNVFGANITNNEYKNGQGIITFDGNVTTIGNLAYYQCSKLASIELPSTVTRIDDNAFWYCSNLTSFFISSSITSLGCNAFRYCTKLQNINIASDNPYYYSIDGIVYKLGRYNERQLAIFPGGRTKCVISNDVKSIHPNAFIGGSIKELIIVDSQDDLTFETKSDAGSTVSIYGLRDCPLETIYIGRNISYTYVYNCPSPFHNITSLSSVSIGTYVTQIEDYLFSNCTGIESINITNNIIRLGLSCLYNTAFVNSISSENGIKYVGDFAYKYTGEDGCLMIKDGTKYLSDGLIYSNDNIMEIALPKSIKSLPSTAFSSCTKLKNVTLYWTKESDIPAYEPSLNVAQNIARCELFVPNGYINLYQETSPWNKFKSITGFGNINITNIDDSNGSMYITSNDKMPLSDNIKSISIAEGINNVNVTYTRNFEKAGVWQAWYMPFDVDFDDMKSAYDVAQIHGVLLDKDNNAVLAFLKLDNGTVKANTPYVVRPKASGEVSIETTTDLQSTVSKSFDLKSATDIYYLGGVYEKTTTPGNWYALNLDGQFQLMGNGVYLRPFRIYMSIDPRTDNPYAQSASTTAKMDIVVIGDGETTGITSYENDNDNENLKAMTKGEGAIYNLSGLRVNSIQKGQIYIMNGKKYIAK